MINSELLEVMNVDYKQIKLVVYKLKGCITTWWDILQKKKRKGIDIEGINVE